MSGHVGFIINMASNHEMDGLGVSGISMLGRIDVDVVFSVSS